MKVWHSWSALGQDVFVEDVQPREEFARSLLNSADSRYLTVAEGVITITAENGTWRYRIDGPGSFPDTVSAVLLDDEGGTTPTEAVA